MELVEKEIGCGVPGRRWYGGKDNIEDIPKPFRLW